MASDKPLTIITPTYNRAYTLPNCYGSLCQQTDKRFVWMVVDDGSTDNTKDLIAQWMGEKKIDILYYPKANGGKASALNVGLDHLDTQYAVCLDSDDIFYMDAVAKAIGELDSIVGEERCCGILTLRSNPDGTFMGGQHIPQSIEYITFASFLNLHIKTELTCFYKSDILKEYRFPEFEGEKFITPGWMMYRITEQHVFKVSWEKYCRCKYLDDGLTRNKKKTIIKNPRGYVCLALLGFNNAATLEDRIKSGIKYDYGCILAKDKDWLKDVKHKFLAVLLYPVGAVLAVILPRIYNK